MTTSVGLEGPPSISCTTLLGRCLALASVGEPDARNQRIPSVPTPETVHDAPGARVHTRTRLALAGAAPAIKRPALLLCHESGPVDRDGGECRVGRAAGARRRRRRASALLRQTAHRRLRVCARAVSFVGERWHFDGLACEDRIGGPLARNGSPPPHDLMELVVLGAGAPRPTARGRAHDLLAVLARPHHHRADGHGAPAERPTSPRSSSTDRTYLHALGAAVPGRPKRSLDGASGPNALRQAPKSGVLVDAIAVTRANEVPRRPGEACNDARGTCRDGNEPMGAPTEAVARGKGSNDLASGSVKGPRARRRRPRTGPAPGRLRRDASGRWGRLGTTTCNHCFLALLLPAPSWTVSMWNAAATRRTPHCAEQSAVSGAAHRRLRTNCS